MKKLTKSLLAGAALIPGVFAFTACGGSNDQFKATSVDTTGEYTESNMDDFKAYTAELEEAGKGFNFVGFKLSADVDFDLTLGATELEAQTELGNVSVAADAQKYVGKLSETLIVNQDSEKNLGVASKTEANFGNETLTAEAYVPYDGTGYLAYDYSLGGNKNSGKYQVDVSEYVERFKSVLDGIETDGVESLETLLNNFSNEDEEETFDINEILEGVTVEASANGNTLKYKFSLENGLELDGVELQDPVAYLVFEDGVLAGVAVDVTLNLDMKSLMNVSGTVALHVAITPYTSKINFPKLDGYQEVNPQVAAQMPMFM